MIYDPYIYGVLAAFFYFLHVYMYKKVLFWNEKGQHPRSCAFLLLQIAAAATTVLFQFKLLKWLLDNIITPP